jgi:carboxylesterase
VSKKEKNQRSGVMKGAEPVYLENKGAKAALLIHGFIGSPSDFGRLPKLLYENGYTVSVPLLPGHGTDPRHFSKTTPEELETFVLEEYKKLKQKYQDVTLIGFSLGGALSILTALREKVDRLVLLAPYLRIAHQWYYIFPTEFYNAMLLNLIPYTYRPASFRQINKKEASADIVDYDFVSLKGGDTAIKLGNKALKEASGLNQPTLIIHGSKDRATDYNFSVKLAKDLEKKNICSFVSLPNSNHMVMLDYDAKLAEKEILAFMTKTTLEKNAVRSPAVDRRGSSDLAFPP